MSIKRRLDQLEATIKPDGTWYERQPYSAVIREWMKASIQGMFLDFSSGRTVTLEELQVIAPEQAARIMDVENPDGL